MMKRYLSDFKYIVLSQEAPGECEIKIQYNNIIGLWIGL